MAYAQHPLSAAFPAMTAVEFQALKDSIENIGIQNAITLYEGMVIDGWHRYTASQELGMPCPEVELGDVDPVDFVKAQNKERRHLSAGAWALIETELWQWRAVGKPASANSASDAENSLAISARDAADSLANSAPGAEYHDPKANSVPGAELASKTSAEMAASAGVGVRTIERAKKVGRDAVPEIQSAVKSGAVSLKDAHAVADMPKEEQAALAAAGPAAIKQAARAKKPAPQRTTAAAPSVEHDDRESPEDAERELLADHERLLADNQMMGRVFESDDRLAAAMAEIARLTEENRVLTTRVQGLMNEKDAAVKAAKAYKRKLDALEKRTGAA